MKLVAEVLTGTLFHVEICEDATVRDLKDKIGTQENLPTKRLILMLDADGTHCLLDDNQNPVKEYGVKDGSRIYILFQSLKNEPPPLEEPPPASPSSRSTSSQESISKGNEAISATPLSPESTSSKMKGT